MRAFWNVLMWLGGGILALGALVGVNSFVLSALYHLPTPTCAREALRFECEKKRWAYDKRTNDLVTWEDLKRDGVHLPSCPKGGVYSLGNLKGEEARCSIPEH